MNHIETARGYGSSELQLGRVLPKLERARLIVQTKVGPTEEARTFTEKFATSLDNLGLEYVDLLGLHGINNRQKLEWSLRKGGCLEAALKLKAEGRVRHIGFSTHAETELILELVRTGAFDYVNLHYYYVNLLNAPVLEAATLADMGVFIISPNDKGGRLYAAPAKLRSLVEPLTPMQYNDLYCLKDPRIHTLSVGAARPSDLDEHVAALAHYERIDAVLPAIEARLDAELLRAHGADWCARWAEGIPPHDRVPGGVNAREILRLFTYAKSLELWDWAKGRYDLLGNADDWFPGNNAGVLDEAALRESFAKSPFPDRLIRSLREAHVLLSTASPVKRLSQS
jgi:predicted aldo/keto reductase-like oxidoreductase